MARFGRKTPARGDRAGSLCQAFSSPAMPVMVVPDAMDVVPVMPAVPMRLRGARTKANAEAIKTFIGFPFVEMVF